MTAQTGRVALEGDRALVRSHLLRGARLVDYIASHPPARRDRVIEELLGIADPPTDSAPPAPGAIGYLPSGVAAIVRALIDVPVEPDDVLIDLGAGLGKVTMLAHLLVGARARGIELQRPLVVRARAEIASLALDGASMVEADVRDAELDDGTVFFLYLPFTGAVMDAVMDRLRGVAERRAIVVCALGIELRGVDWLVARASSSFWLTSYDSVCPGALPRRRDAASTLPAAAEEIANEVIARCPRGSASRAG